LWISSSDATRPVFTAAAIVTMAIAVVLTASRSGFAGLLLVAALWGGWFRRKHQPAERRRLGAAVFLVMIVMVAMSWGRVDTVLARYEDAPRDVRFTIWQDALRIVRDAPWTGTGLNTYGIAMLHYQTVDDGF